MYEPYFDNSDSIQLIDQKRSEKYEIIRKIPEKNLELKDNDNNKDRWFFKKELRDIKVKDFTLGQETENGKKLFIFQAAEAFKIWHNIQPEINEEESKLLDK